MIMKADGEGNISGSGRTKGVFDPSADWAAESVIEWTDTTQSALRHRVTRAVSAQVAGKSGDATTLYTLHIAKDRRTDGSWGPLHGHIMFKDPILEENVQK